MEATSTPRSIILLTGLSGSGKSQVATALRTELSALGTTCNLIDLDWFFIPGHDPLRYDDPSSVAWHGLNFLLSTLLSGSPAGTYLYNKSTSELDCRAHFLPNPIIILTCSMVPHLSKVNSHNVSLWIHLSCKPDECRRRRERRNDSLLDIPWSHVYAQYLVHGVPDKKDMRMPFSTDEPAKSTEIRALANQCLAANLCHSTNMDLPHDPMQKFSLRGPPVAVFTAPVRWSKSFSVRELQEATNSLNSLRLRGEDVPCSAPVPSGAPLTNFLSKYLTHPEDRDELASAPVNYIGELQELCVKRHWELPTYMDVLLPADTQFTVACSLRGNETHGRGTTKKHAKSMSAKAMLAIVK